MRTTYCEFVLECQPKMQYNTNAIINVTCEKNVSKMFIVTFQVEEFFRKYPDGGAGSRGRDQLRESIQRNIDWMGNNAATIATWLDGKITMQTMSTNGPKMHYCTFVYQKWPERKHLYSIPGPNRQTLYSTLSLF